MSARLRSPSLPQKQGLSLSFYYHMHGSTIGTLNVYRKSNLGDQLLWSKNGNQSNVWHAGTVEFAHNGYGNNYIVFEGIGGSSYTGDIAIDDISIGGGIPFTAMPISTDYHITDEPSSRPTDKVTERDRTNEPFTTSPITQWHRRTGWPVTSPNYNMETTSGPSQPNITETFLCGNETHIITSPGYPNQYGNNQYIEWPFTTHVGSLLSVEFYDFDLEGWCDYVTIYSDGGIIGRFSGSSTPPITISTNNTIKIVFTTDGSVVENGFQAKVRVYPEAPDGFCSDFNNGFSGWNHSYSYNHWMRSSERQRHYNDSDLGNRYSGSDNYFIYVASNYGEIGSEYGNLDSPYLPDRWNEVCLRFYYYMSEDVNQYIYVYEYSNYGGHRVFTEYADYSRQWKSASVTINTSNKYNSYLRIIGRAHSTFYYDTEEIIAVDDIYISEGACSDYPEVPFTTDTATEWATTTDKPFTITDTVTEWARTTDKHFTTDTVTEWARTTDEPSTDAVTEWTTRTFNSEIQTNFQYGFDGWTQEYGDDFDWSRNNGSTSSSNTGPTNGHSGYGSDYYVYIETSSPRNNRDSARLRSPRIPERQGLSLSFYYHMYGDTMGTLNVYRTSNLGDQLLWSRNGNQSNVWHAGTVQFAHNGYGNNYIIFEGIRGSSFTGDIAIDDIYIGDRIPFTAIPTSTDDHPTASSTDWPVTTPNYNWETTSPSQPNVTKTFLCGNKTQIITSPGYPNYYGNNQYIEWKFTTHVGSYLSVEFYDFDLEGCCDYVTVYSDGDMIGRFSGSSTPSLTISTNNNIKIVFTTDGSVVEKGFQADVYVYPESPGFCSDFNDGYNGWTDYYGNNIWMRSSERYDGNNNLGSRYSGSDDYYIYVANNYGHSGSKYGYLNSPIIPDRWNEACLRFYYYMSGNSNQGIYVYHYAGNYGQFVFTVFDDYSQRWKPANVTINTVNKYNNYMVFLGIAYGTEIVAVDDIYISEGACSDYPDEPSATDVVTEWDRTTDVPFTSSPFTEWPRTTSNDNTDTTTVTRNPNGSCFGKCGGYDQGCFCDNICEAERDCCSDYFLLCANNTTVSTERPTTTSYYNVGTTTGNLAAFR
ncbi:MAM and LDL-receptor class A domain-containing protein 1-like [Antedon mediterranea]|uniref:MAM and LDL-receptor class A domain-containing protein 1-like n=1 Tax=Antedon mediterranea TaxID=105859 RepID=UPI003AF947ED